jgi:PadR family transcriptional regulator AphA
MRRTAHYFWPRAESNLYAEPKRLVKGGFAEARTERVGKRPRTVYSITEKGREALTDWLSQPPAATRVESEVLMKTIFATYGSKADLLSNLHEYRAQLADKQDELLAIFRQYVSGNDPYPDRVHVNVVVFKLIWEYTQVETRWVDWALSVAERWPDVVGPHNRDELMQALEEIIRSVDGERPQGGTAAVPAAGVGRR